jgi:hypothetical protein
MRALVVMSAAIALTVAAQGNSHAASATASSSDPPLSDEEIRQRIYQDDQAIDQQRFLPTYYSLVDMHPTAKQVDSYVYKQAGLTPPTAGPTKPTSCYVAPHIFVRRDRLDTFQLREQAEPLSSAKGASISGTDDMRASSEQLVVNGRIQYLMYGYDAACGGSQLASQSGGSATTPAYGFAFAPFVDGQGTIDTPMKKTDIHNLQAGFDAQFNVLGGPLFDDQYVILTPYYQTDFVGEAQIEGVTAAWEPVLIDAHLGGYSGLPGPYIGWYWQLRAEFDEKHVNEVGFTGLAKGNYDWFGGTIQAHFDFFPNAHKGEPYYVSPDPWLEDRLYMNLTLKSFWNAADNRSATWGEAELGYNLTPDGKSSISVKYDRGTDKDTLITAKKYLLALNFKN